MILAFGSEKPVHEGRLLFRATFFRSDKDSTGVGRSYWGHSPKAALGYCLRVCHGYADWPADQYVALSYAKWIGLVRMQELPDDALPDLLATRRAARPQKPPQPIPQKEPVDPLAPTDSAPPAAFPQEQPTKRIRSSLPPKPKPARQLALVF